MSRTTGVGTPRDSEFEALLRYLKEQRGFDFTGYKRASLARRIDRRVAAVGATGYEGYQDHLAVHPEEFAALFNTILINVTGFFRDSDAWQYLESQVLPRLVTAKPTGPVRAWCAGCASGEEAYSLAILLAEAMGVEQFRQRVKIYATDVDEDALALARAAQYSDRQVAHLPADLRDRYFEKQNQRYVVCKDLRRSVIFGRNDLVQDAPISHVDVLACRNTLMYFTAETQYQILRRLHFALEPDGVLFLGKAEMLLNQATLFRPLDLKRRFFTKVVAARERRLLIPSPVLDPPDVATLPVEQLARSALLSSAPAQVLLDADRRLAFVNGRAGRLFALSETDLGRPVGELEMSYRPVELQTPLDQAARERRPVEIGEVAWPRGKEQSLVFDVHVAPLLDDGGSLVGFAVVFDDVTQSRALRQELEFANRQLETAYEEVQSTNEELETTNEELQSTVEELETTNEELQSTVEELETMNEELQSMNDELQTSNEALQDRQDEVDRLNALLGSVLGSLTAGIAVVDPDLRVLAWNATAEQLWGVRAEEALGEHLFNLDIGLPLSQVRPLLKHQLGDESGDPESIRLDAVNRRGRPVQVAVTVTRLLGDSEEAGGAIVVMDVIEAGDSSAPDLERGTRRSRTAAPAGEPS